MTIQDLQNSFMAANPSVDINSPDGYNQFLQYAQSIAGQSAGGNIGNTPLAGAAGGSSTGFGQSLGGLVNQGVVGFNPTTGPSNSFLDIANSALNLGSLRAKEGGNTNEVQGSANTGLYNTIGSQNTTNQQSQVGLTNQNTTGQTNQSSQGFNNQQNVSTGQQQQMGQTQNLTSGTSNTATSGSQIGQTQNQQQQMGTTTSGVVDPYGFGGMVRNNVQNAQGVDAQRQQFLTGMMQNGNPYLQQQTAQAVNQALSGPGMVGVGDGGVGRAAAFAANQVAMNSAGNQLAASQQLAGPTATQQALSEAPSYLGSSTTSNQNTLGSTLNNLFSTSNQTGSNSQQSLGNSLSNLFNTNVANQTGTTGSNTTGTSNQNTTGTTANVASGSSQQNASQSGQAAGSNIGIATGQVPQQQVSGGSGCFVCTVYVEKGWMRRKTVQRGVMAKVEKMRLHKVPLMGYMVWGPKFALFLRKHEWAAKTWYPIARATLYQECRMGSKRFGFKFGAFFWHSLFVLASTPLGLFGKKYVKNPEVVKLLEGQKLNFAKEW